MDRKKVLSIHKLGFGLGRRLPACAVRLSAGLFVTAFVAACTGNHLPSWESSPDVTVDSGSNGVIYTAVATDADGDTVTYGAVGALPSGWTLNTETGELTILDALSQQASSQVQLELAAYDGHGGASILDLTVNFVLPETSTAVNIVFPPNKSHLNLDEDERATLLVKNTSGAGRAITSVALSVGERIVDLSLTEDQTMWRGELVLPSGEVNIDGEVTYDDGESAKIGGYTLYVNSPVFAGTPEEGQLQAGHQLDSVARKLYYMQGSHVFSRDLDTGDEEILWQSDDVELSYFGVSKNAETLYLLQQLSAPFNYSQLASYFAAGPSPATGPDVSEIGEHVSGPNDFNQADSGVPRWVLKTVDLITGTETQKQIESEISEFLNLSIFAAEFDSHQNSFVINLYGMGGGGSGGGESGAPDGEPAPELNSSFENYLQISNFVVILNAMTQEVTPLLTTSADGLSASSDLFFADAQDGKVFKFDFERSELVVNSVSEDGLIEDYIVNGFAAGQLATDAGYMASEDGFGRIVVSHFDFTGASDFNISLAEITEGSSYRVVNMCDIPSANYNFDPIDDLRVVSKDCLNGIPYDISVDEQTDIVYVSSFWIHPDGQIALDNSFSAPPFLYRSVQAVSLLTGEAVTVFSGY